MLHSLSALATFLFGMVFGATLGLAIGFSRGWHESEDLLKIAQTGLMRLRLEWAYATRPELSDAEVGRLVRRLAATTAPTADRDAP